MIKPPHCPLCQDRVLFDITDYPSESKQFNCFNHYDNTICPGFYGWTKRYISIGYYDGAFIMDYEKQKVYFNRGIILNSIQNIDVYGLGKEKLYQKINLYLTFS